jgi:hypothetical protein
MAVHGRNAFGIAAVARPKLLRKSLVEKQQLTGSCKGEFDRGREIIEYPMMVDAGCGRPRFRTDVTSRS